jgi:murein DD-endopeptidase MepM/ murein hydrolase activator NlpD
MRNRKYFLDPNDLQYKQVRLPWKQKLFRFLCWVAGTVAITIFYMAIFQKYFGSPKEHLLNQQINGIKLQYSLTGMELDNFMKSIKSLELSDEVRYRPILTLDSIPSTIRNPGFGGVERFREINNYMNTDLMRSMRRKVEEMKNMTLVQGESFSSIMSRSQEWKHEMDHLPAISPVDPTFRLGDGFRFREKHPVLGIGRMHYGQDFEVPYGTRVYATGNGTVIQAGYNTGGFGNYVIIDHGYGLQSIYAHLSKINVSKGLNLKRGDNVGLSGDSGTSSGPHLHYQINKYGTPVSAINFFNNDITREEFNEMIQAFGTRSIFR